MCLLLVSFRSEPSLPLVVAANRDERYSRKASTTALRSHAPMVLAGRDDEAGGTWLAVNDRGVVAGLTNQPSGAGRDPSKRTRGELPLLATRYEGAVSAVDALVAAVDPTAYNPCSLLIGDRTSLFSVEVDDRASRLRVRELQPGRYVLENRPFGVPTAKTEYMRQRLLALPLEGEDEALCTSLRALLADHTVPERWGDDRSRRPAVMASCVHTPDYGTRSATIVVVRSESENPPAVFVADGAPCTSAFHEVAWH